MKSRTLKGQKTKLRVKMGRLIKGKMSSMKGQISLEGCSRTTQVTIAPQSFDLKTRIQAHQEALTRTKALKSPIYVRIC